MKKFIITDLLISILLFSSCKLDVQSEKKLNRPEYEIINGGIEIRGVYSSSDLEYINIFRQDVTGSDPEQPVNIGIIFPSGFHENDKTFAFLDKEAIADNKYQYFCRYYDKKDGYYYTNNTETITIPASAGLPAGTPLSNLTISTASSVFVYNETAKTLLINGAPTMPTHTPPYDLALVVKSANATQAFVLEKNANISASMEFSLPSILPDSFLNTEIQICGVIGQSNEYVDPTDPTSNIKRIYWTPLSTITLNDTSSPAVAYPDNKIIISTKSGTNGVDFGY